MPTYIVRVAQGDERPGEPRKAVYKVASQNPKEILNFGLQNGWLVQGREYHVMPVGQLPDNVLICSELEPEARQEHRSRGNSIATAGEEVSIGFGHDQISANIENDVSETLRQKIGDMEPSEMVEEN